MVCLVFEQGGFIESYTGLVIFSASFSCVVICIIHGEFITLRKPAELMAPFLHCALGVLRLIVGRMVLNWNVTWILRFLDDLREEPSLFSTISNPRKALHSAVVGFTAAHEACLDWSFFEAGRNTMPHGEVCGDLS
jgi:hypothetical protein